MARKKETKKDVNTIHRRLRIILANSLAVIGLSWGPEQKRNRTDPTLTKPDGSWDQTAEKMLANFSGSGPPIFRASSAFERGELRSRGRATSLFTSLVVMETSSCFPAL